MLNETLDPNRTSHHSHRSTNVLNQTIYSPHTQLPLSTRLWWESFGMFGLIMMICQINPFYGFDLWVSALLTIAIMLSVKQSGAHYNTTMTISNFLIKFGPAKIDYEVIWLYFRADFIPAFVAWNIGFYLKGYYYPPPTPSPSLSAPQILISQLIGSFMLVVLLQKIVNTQTTFTTSDIQTYSFIVVFVYVARRFAVLSGNNINMVATFACACAAVVQCSFGHFKWYYLYFGGDLLGSVLGSYFYNWVLQPAIQISRRQKQEQQYKDSQQTPQHSSKIYQQLETKTPIKIVIKLIQEQQTLERNKLTRIEHRSDVCSDREAEMRFIDSHFQEERVLLKD